MTPPLSSLHHRQYYPRCHIHHRHSASTAITIPIAFWLLVLPCVHAFSSSITEDTPLHYGGQTLVSEGGAFELGFFTTSPFPGVETLVRPSSEYVGIWYHNKSPRTVVWVANREMPLIADASAQFGIRNGNLVVTTSGGVHWSTWLPPHSSSKLTARLLDSGNLVLTDGERIFWESFKHPSDTFLPGMLMDGNLELISWKGLDDPAVGEFKLKLEDYDQRQRKGENRLIIRKDSLPYWKRKKAGNFSRADDIPIGIDELLSNVTVDEGKGRIRCPWCTFDSPQPFKFTRLVMNFTGVIEYLGWADSHWELLWSAPTDDRCGLLNPCGNFSTCNSNNRVVVCKCMPGFKPREISKWEAGDSSGGCVRETKLSCSRNDKFQNLQLVSVSNPELQMHVNTEPECRSKCLGSCSCQAYFYNGWRVPTTCYAWLADLRDAVEEYRHEHSRQFPPPSEPQATHSWTVIVTAAAALTSTAIVLAIGAVCIWRRRQGRMKHAELIMDTDFSAADVPFFDFQSIRDATNDFSAANTLGRGGYGPVYKGNFAGGQTMAVKRLAQASRQGLQEFRNEVLLISKLQHRNLVQIKGYCMAGEEKIVLYEYMSNKSLDSFIFGHAQNCVLNWEMRLRIIVGVARGILYLHQDSRLRIIHRDIKTSNILLDAEMNPKISDFGLARTLGVHETEKDTNKIAGTHGYVSPELFSHGTYSVKSDVFSFGVVLLEIISGKKNSASFLTDEAWKLWNENNLLDLMETSLTGSCDKHQFVKCATIGLLCIQEDPDDRPTMSEVVTLLDSKMGIPPSPKPGVSCISRCSIPSPPPINQPASRAELTDTLVEGR